MTKKISFERHHRIFNVWPRILAICVVEDVSKRLDIPILEQSWSILQFYLSMSRYCIQLLVPHNFCNLAITSITFAAVILDADDLPFSKNCVGPSVATWTLFFVSLCFQDNFLVTLDFFSKFHAGIVLRFFHSLPTAAFASGILIACGIVKQIVCRERRFHSLLGGFMRFHYSRKSFLESFGMQFLALQPPSWCQFELSFCTAGPLP